jgi:hypothetical protein
MLGSFERCLECSLIVASIMVTQFYTNVEMEGLELCEDVVRVHELHVVYAQQYTNTYESSDPQ